MTQPKTQPEALPRPPREEQAWQEVGKTDMPRWLAAALTVAFVALIVAVPVSQVFYETSSEEGEYQADDLFTIGPDIGAKWSAKEGGPFKKLLAANAETLRQINRYESDLEDASWLTHLLLGPVTEVQAKLLGAGNEEAYLGRDGWLFFRQDFDHVTGTPFLDPERLEAIAKSGNEYTAPPQPDPRLSIIQFRDQLKERGIELIIVPTPVKPTVHPEMLSGRFTLEDPPARNPSFTGLIAALDDAKVTVYDPAEDLRAWARDNGKPSYLASDTHWRAAAMRSVAATLADRVREADPELQPGHPSQRVATASPVSKVSHLGDIAQMLELPEGQTLLEPETVDQVQVTGPDGEPWQPTRGAPVLLLGDSFTNIYSMEALGWGTHGGLGAHLSEQLNLPVDVIAINAGGAHAARQDLVAGMARGNDRLADTKVVIWQFATRELSFGDWKLLDLPVVEAKDPAPKLAAGEVFATAVIVDKKPPPKPGSVPYRDAIIAIRVKDLKAEGDAALPEEALIYAWGMRDNKLVDEPWVVGQTVRIKLKPWADAEAEFGSFNREELDDPDVLFMDAFWAEVVGD